MSKKQFTLDSWLKDKSQKVVTRCGFPVRIVCTDVKRKDYPILALVERDDQEEYQSFTKDGRFSLYNPLHDNFDLFIETNEVSEDKIVIRALKSHLTYMEEKEGWKGVAGIKMDRILDWLEKQAEQKPADTVEPKFNVGDKIRRKTPSSFDKDMQVARIEKDYYVCNHIGKFSSEVVPFSKQSSYELIEQKPALGEEDEAVLDALIRRLEGEDIYVSTHLAVKCLKSIKDRVQPKQEWSEEDETVLNNLIYALANDRIGNNRDEYIDWLKSLRPQNRWKPSDEQLEFLQKCIKAYNEVTFSTEVRVLSSLYHDLKKLKEE